MNEDPKPIGLEPSGGDASGNGEPLLEVTNLATGYGDIRAVWDVSLKVWPGRVSVLLGRNGAGKTTTLRAISGLNKADAGRILFEGVDITGMSAFARVHAGIALVQEGKRIFRRRTIEENLLLGGYSLGLGKRKLQSELVGIYDMFPVLADRKHVTSGQLSGGQQQMLAIGQALMAKPKLLMLDEPSGGLAPSITAEVMAKVDGLRETGIGILLVEQAVTAALAVADRVTVLDVGRVLLDQPASELAGTNALTEAYFGRT